MKDKKTNRDYEVITRKRSKFWDNPIVEGVGFAALVVVWCWLCCL